MGTEVGTVVGTEVGTGWGLRWGLFVGKSNGQIDVLMVRGGVGWQLLVFAGMFPIIA